MSKASRCAGVSARDGGDCACAAGIAPATRTNSAAAASAALEQFQARLRAADAALLAE
jgi:hypothetical protein